MEQPSSNHLTIPKIVTDDNDETEKTFDGVFFSVQSPIQKAKSPRLAAAISPQSPISSKSPHHSPSRSPASGGITKSTGGDR